MTSVYLAVPSRDLKDNIAELSAEDATRALNELTPVRYVYKNSRDEEYIGFIAEDVPALVANNDRKSLSSMDIVAVLTKVTKEQGSELAVKDLEIAELRKTLAEQAEDQATQREALAQQQDRMLQMEMPLVEVLRNQQDIQQVSSLN